VQLHGRNIEELYDRRLAGETNILALLVFGIFVVNLKLLI
jgi:hypothetical protein